MTSSRGSIPLAAVLLAATVAAQKHPVPGDAARAIQVYDVRDLVADPDKAEAVPADPQRGPDRPGPKAEVTAHKLRLPALAALVADFVDPPLADGEEIKSIGTGNLLALGTPDKLAWIDRFLLLNRRQDQQHVEVEARVARLGADSFDRLVKPLLDASDRQVAVAAEPLPQSATGRTGPLVNVFAPPPEPVQKYALLAGGAAQELLAQLAREPGAEMLHAPRVAARPLTRASVHLGKSIAYIRDFEIEVAAGQTIANPIVDVVKEGIHLECTLAVVREGVAALDFHFASARLQRPIPTFTTTIGKGAPITIELPELTVAQLESKVELTPESTALFALRTMEKDYLVLTLRARLVPADSGKARGDGADK